jgi:hypothetical protein
MTKDFEPDHYRNSAELRKLLLVEPHGRVSRPETVVVAGATKRLTNLDALNARFALLEALGSASIYVSRGDFLPIQDMDLKRRIASEVVEIGAKDGRPVYGSAFAFWTGHAQRHIYRGVVFTSDDVGPDELNLFRGLGVTPKPGKCALILAHIRDVICDGDLVAYDAMMRLMAWQLQNIGKPSRIVVVLKTRKQQAGKGVLLGELLTKIYGPSGFAPSATDQVFGRFNDAIRGRSYVFMDEILFAGDRKAADAVKSLSTCTIIGIETKGLPVVQCPVAVNLWLASNHDNAAHIEEGDARYWVLDVSEQRIGDDAYFAALMAEVNNGGREAFAHHLLDLDVSGFIPQRDVPKENAAKRAMIRLSVNPYDARKWIEDCAHAERIIGRKNPMTGEWAEWIAGEEYAFATLSAAADRRWLCADWRLHPFLPFGSLGEILTRAGFTPSDARRKARGRILPPVEECLSRLWA